MIKTLAASIRDYIKPTIATPLLVLCEVACEMAIPFVTANLIDTIKAGASVEQILPTAGILVLLALVSLFFWRPPRASPAAMPAAALPKT